MSTLNSAGYTPIQVFFFSNSSYHMKTLPDLVHPLHRACFSPVVDTWWKTIDAGYFTTWPGLTSRLVRKHLPNYTDTANGHLRLSRQHVRSTSAQPPLTPPPSQYTNLWQRPEISTRKTHPKKTWYVCGRSKCQARYFQIKPADSPESPAGGIVQWGCCMTTIETPSWPNL